MKIIIDAASAKEEAAATFPEEVGKLIKEEGYHPKHVFNCNETRFFWKMMPNRTYIYKNAKEGASCSRSLAPALKQEDLGSGVMDYEPIHHALTIDTPPEPRYPCFETPARRGTILFY